MISADFDPIFAMIESIKVYQDVARAHKPQQCRPESGYPSTQFVMVRRGTMFMLCSSWKRSLHAYGIRSVDTLSVVHERA
jgi:hypothetical protein